MGLPGHRRTSSHKRRRASHFALDKSVPGVCEKCKQPVQQHHACKNCGFYRGRAVVDMTRDTARLAKRIASKRPVVAKAAPKAEKAAKPAKAAKAVKAEEADHEDHTGHDHA